MLPFGRHWLHYASLPSLVKNLLFTNCTYTGCKNKYLWTVYSPKKRFKKKSTKEVAGLLCSSVW